MAEVFLAPPLMSTAHLQRQAHSAHHHYLGTKDDPDHGLHNDTSLKHCRVSLHCFLFFLKKFYEKNLRNYLCRTVVLITYRYFPYFSITYLITKHSSNIQLIAL